MVNKGYALANLGRLEEAIAAYEEVERRLGQARETALQEWLARALIYKGGRLPPTEAVGLAEAVGLGD